MSVSSTGARVFSFHAAVEARAEQARAKVATNARSVVLGDGRTVQAQSVRVTSADRLALARVQENTGYFADAEANGVPVRVMRDAWNNYRAARAGIEGLTLSWGGARDCRSLVVSYGDREVGRLSILDDNRPRSAMAIRESLDALVRRHG